MRDSDYKFQFKALVQKTSICTLVGTAIANMQRELAIRINWGTKKLRL